MSVMAGSCRAVLYKYSTEVDHRRGALRDPEWRWRIRCFDSRVDPRVDPHLRLADPEGHVGFVCSRNASSLLLNLTPFFLGLNKPKPLTASDRRVVVV